MRILRFILLLVVFWQVSTVIGAATPLHGASINRPTHGSSEGGHGPFTLPTQSNTLRLRAGKGLFTSAVIDTAAGFVYFGTETVPGQIIKIRLSDFRWVETLTLEPGEGALSSAVIDPTAGFAYFGTDTKPGRVIKVRLSDFSRVDALTLSADENRLMAAVIDPDRGFALFGAAALDAFGSASTGRIVKIRLADFSRVGALPLNEGEDFPRSAVIDPAGDMALFGMAGRQVVKVRLSDLTHSGTLTLAEDEGNLVSAVIHPSEGYALFGSGLPASGGGGSKVVKVRLADLTRVGAVTLTDQEFMIFGAAIIDPARDLAMFGAFQPLPTKGRLVTIRLSDFTRRESFLRGESAFGAAVVDTVGGFAFFGSLDYPGYVGKVPLFRGPPEHWLDFEGEDRLLSAVVDSKSGVAIFGTFTSPSEVVKVRLSDFSRVGTLTLTNEVGYVRTALIDPWRDYAYFGTGDDGLAVRVRLSDFSQVDSIKLMTHTNEIGIFTQIAVIDPKREYAIFGVTAQLIFATRSQESHVVKVRLSDFQVVGRLVLPIGEEYLRSAVIDPAGQFVYFGTDTYPGRVVKVRVSDMTRVAALTLNTGENALRSAVIDTAGEFALFGTDTYPGRVVKVRLADLSRVAALTLNEGENRLRTAVFNMADGVAIFGSAGPLMLLPPCSPGHAVRVRMADLTRLDSIPLGAGACNPSSSVIDWPSGYVLFGTDTRPGVVARVPFDTIPGRIPRLFAPLILNRGSDARLP